MPRFAALLILLLLAACNATSTVDPSATGAVDNVAFIPTEDGLTAAPFIMPTPPPPPPPACPNAPRTRLILHERGRVLPDDPRPVNMRPEPGLAQTILAQIPVEGIFYVLEGPVCEGDFAWFMVSYRGREGWIAEGEMDFYYVEPYLVG